MIIGIDIDGVLTDIEQWEFDYGTKYFYEKYRKEIKNADSYSLRDLFDLTEEQADEFWDKHFIEYVKTEPVRKFADEVINKLHEQENKIYIITARYSTNENEEMRTLVKDWLQKNNIYYDKLLFSPAEKKVDVCKENNVDIMIEDKPETINAISKNIPVICFNAVYNKKCEGTNIIRCYSWYDIYQKISNLILS